MGGGWQTYRCDRCPLIVELGGSTFWDDDRVVISKAVQVACGGCGTMHRLTDRKGVWSVTAIPGPVRETRIVSRPDGWGGEYESLEWATEDEWHPIPSPGEVPHSVDQLACSHCGAVGRMVTHEALRHPDGKHTPLREVCPVCRGPVECFAVTDAI